MCLAERANQGAIAQSMRSDAAALRFAAERERGGSVRVGHKAYSQLSAVVLPRLSSRFVLSETYTNVHLRHGIGLGR